MRIADHSQTRRWVLMILMLVNFVNYVDRQIIFSLFPEIQRTFGLNFTELGSLATAFTVVLSLASFPLGMLADRISRRAVISAGVLFWSGATFFSGLAGSFHSLLAARGLVGIGEAAYAPAGSAVISAVFPEEMRARVQGAFDIGMFIGGAVGIALGGVMAEAFGWRSAFYIIGAPGAILGLFALRLPRLPSGSLQQHVGIRELLRVPAYVALLLSGWFCSFAGYAYVAWGPEFVQRYRGFNARQAGVSLGITLVVSGTTGIVAGAYLSDLLAKLRAWGRPIIIPIGFVLGAPAIFLALHSASNVEFFFYFGLGAFFLSWYHGPLTATIHDLVPPHGRATALGFYYLFVNLFAMAMAPLIVGWIADRSNLISAFNAPITSQLIGAALFMLVIQSIRRHGLHHPALARHWGGESSQLWPPATASAVGAPVASLESGAIIEKEAKKCT